jgi:hypothetical protein
MVIYTTREVQKRGVPSGAFHRRQDDLPPVHSPTEGVTIGEAFVDVARPKADEASPMA